MCNSWRYFGSWSVLAVPIRLIIVEFNFLKNETSDDLVSTSVKKYSTLKQRSIYLNLVYNIPIYLPVLYTLERVILINGLLGLLNENKWCYTLGQPAWELSLRLRANFVRSYCSVAYPTGFLKHFPSCNPVRPWITGSLYFLRDCCRVSKYRYN